MSDDAQLLRAYAEHRDETAFAQLVNRYINLVWGAGYRVTGDADLAKDVTQTAFTELARASKRLSAKVSLSGWLYRVAYHTAAKLVRASVRRASRERQLMEMHSLNSHQECDQTQIESLLPTLDEAIAKLSHDDRQAIVLRFLRRKSLAEVGAALGVSDDAAQKRLARALDKLRDDFRRRGIAANAALLGAALGTAASQACPAGLAATVAASSVAAAGGACAASLGSFFSNVSNQLAFMKTKLALGAFALASVATPLWIQQNSLAGLRAENSALQDQSALRERLKRENLELQSRQKLADELEGLRKDHQELLELRDEVARLRESESQEKAKLQQSLSAARSAADEARARAARVQAEVEFKETQEHIVNDMKQLGLAARIFANDNGDQLPTSFEEMRNEIGSSIRQEDLERYEFMKHARPVVETEPQLILFREKTPRQRPDGAWSRIYCFVDGSVQQQGSATGDFEEFEKHHTAQDSALAPKP